jgi:hypothetical protein
MRVIAERDRQGVADDAGEMPGRDFGRDGVSGLVSIDRAMRARDVSRPGQAEEEFALQIVDSLIARAEGRPQRAPERVS